LKKNTPREGAAEGIVRSGCAVFIDPAGITLNLFRPLTEIFVSAGRCSFFIVRFRHPELCTNTPDISFDHFIGIRRKKL